MRLLLLVVNTYITILPQGDGDALATERHAYLMSIGEGLNIDALLKSGTGAFRLIGVGIYTLFGRSPFLYGLVNVILGTYVVVYIYKASLLLWENAKLSKRIAWAAAFFPQMLLHSALLLRETPVNFFLALAMLSFIKYWKFGKRKQLYYYVLYILLGTLFHTAVITVLVATFIAFLLLEQGGRTRVQQTLSRVTGIAILLLGVILLNVTGYGLKKFGGSFDNAYTVLEAKEARNAEGAAAFPQWMRIQSNTDLWKLPIRISTFLFSPALPYLVRKRSHLVGLVDGAIYMWMFFLMIKGRANIRRNKSALVLLIKVIVLSVVFSMGTSNFGTAIRHRAKMAPLLLILAVNHKKWEKLNRKKNRVFQIKTNGQNRH